MIDHDPYEELYCIREGSEMVYGVVVRVDSGMIVECDQVVSLHTPLEQLQELSKYLGDAPLTAYENGFVLQWVSEDGSELQLGEGASVRLWLQRVGDGLVHLTGYQVVNTH